MSTNHSLTRVFDLLKPLETHQISDLFCQKRDGEWRKYSCAETLENIQTLALGLLELKVKPGDKIAIISGNRPAGIFDNSSQLMNDCKHQCYLQMLLAG